MSKKYIFAAVAACMVMGNPIFGMYNAAFRLVQGGTSAAILYTGSAMAYKKKKNIDQTDVSDLAPAPASVRKMVHQGLQELQVPNAEQVPVVQWDHPSSPWSTIGDRVVAVDVDTARAIEAGDEKVIQKSELAKYHELWHLLNEDLKKEAYAYAAIPCAVQVTSTGLSYGFNRIIGRKNPRRILSCLFRSSVAVGAVVPKVLLSVCGIFAHSCYQETQADRFACQHAKSREELEAFKNHFDELEEESQKAMQEMILGYDQMDEKVKFLWECVCNSKHPRPANRSAGTQKSIDKWDERA